MPATAPWRTTPSQWLVNQLTERYEKSHLERDGFFCNTKTIIADLIRNLMNLNQSFLLQQLAHLHLQFLGFLTSANCKIAAIRSINNASR